MAETSGFLTTHVLDTARGRPAEGIQIDLFQLSKGERKPLISTATNHDGRTDAPMLAGASFEAGVYELVFHVGPYLRCTSAELTDPLFLDEIPIRFGIHDMNAHYHVPLLVSPYGYSTYRGS